MRLKSPLAENQDASLSPASALLERVPAERPYVLAPRVGEKPVPTANEIALLPEPVLFVKHSIEQVEATYIKPFSLSTYLISGSGTVV